MGRPPWDPAARERSGLASKIRPRAVTSRHLTAPVPRRLSREVRSPAGCGAALGGCPARGARPTAGRWSSPIFLLCVPGSRRPASERAPRDRPIRRAALVTHVSVGGSASGSGGVTRSAVCHGSGSQSHTPGPGPAGNTSLSRAHVKPACRGCHSRAVTPWCHHRATEGWRPARRSFASVGRGPVYVTLAFALKRFTP